MGARKPKCSELELGLQVPDTGSEVDSVFQGDDGLVLAGWFCLW